MKIKRFSKLNEGFLDKSEYFWEVRKNINNFGFDNDEVLDFFIAEIGKEKSKEILEKLHDKLERDDF